MKHFLGKFWPLLCIVFLWFSFSSPYFVKGLVPFPSTYLVTFFPPWNASLGMPVKNNAMPDTISQIYPWKKLTIDTWKTGNIPLWNPYSFSGTPHAANYQSAVFSPFNVLFFLLPFIDAWSVLVLLQPLLAGGGMYLFLRTFTKRKAAAALGSIAFMFCGFMTTWMAYGTLGFAALYLPWAMWAITKEFDDSRALWKFCTALFVALSLVSGHFQISIYIIGSIVLYILYKAKQTGEYKTACILGVCVVCGLLLSAPQLLLTAEAYKNSVRSESFIRAEVIPWQYLITVFAPDYYGNPVTRNDWFGHYAEWASYIGVIPLMLALLALRKNIHGQKAFLILLGILALMLAYQTPANELLFRLKIPALSSSAASRIMILFSFALSALAAIGVDELYISWKEKKVKELWRFFATITFVLIGIWLYMFFGFALAPEKLAIAKRNIILPTAMAVMGILLMLAGYIRKKYIHSAVLITLVVVTCMDMYRYSSKWMPFEQKSFMYPQEESLVYLQKRIGVDRVFGNIGNEAGGMFNLPLIEGYDAMYQGRYGEFINAASSGKVVKGARSIVQFDKAALYKTNILELLGVKYIYHRVSDGRSPWTFPYWEYVDNGSMKQIYNDEKYWIYEYANALPRAYLTSSYAVLTDKNAIISTVFSKDFDRRESVVLEEKPDVEPQHGTGSAQIVRYDPNSLEIKTISEVPKILVLSDTYNEGWRATIDGKDTKIYRANYDFRAIAVPNGEHVIRFLYAPKSFTYGLYLACIAVLLLIIVTIYI